MESGEKLWNLKKNQWRVEKISKLISRTFESKNFRIIKSSPSSRNHRDQYFEKFFRKTWKISQKICRSDKNLEKTQPNFLSHN